MRQPCIHCVEPWKLIYSPHLSHHLSYVNMFVSMLGDLAVFWLYVTLICVLFLHLYITYMHIQSPIVDDYLQFGFKKNSSYAHALFTFNESIRCCWIQEGIVQFYFFLGNTLPTAVHCSHTGIVGRKGNYVTARWLGRRSTLPPIPPPPKQPAPKPPTS